MGGRGLERFDKADMFVSPTFPLVIRFVQLIFHLSASSINEGSALVAHRKMVSLMFDPYCHLHSTIIHKICTPSITNSS